VSSAAAAPAATFGGLTPDRQRLAFRLGMIVSNRTAPSGRRRRALAAAVLGVGGALSSVVPAVLRQDQGFGLGLLYAARGHMAPPEQVVVDGREIYAWHPAGVARSKLWALLAGRNLGVTATARNWTTVTQLLELADEA